MLVDFVYAGYRFHKYVIRYACLRNPDGTKQVRPFAMHGLLECPTLIGTKDTRLKTKTYIKRLVMSRISIPQGSQVRQYISYRAIVPLVCKEHHSSLNIIV